jgi:hypothetical protein
MKMATVLFLLLSFLSLSSLFSYRLFSHPSSSHASSSISRSLYELFPVENGDYRVKTLMHNITEPSGLALGSYKGRDGLFIASTSQNAIYFSSEPSSSSSSSSSSLQLVAGIPNNNGYQDGQMLYSLFSSPTRMAFDSKRNCLYVSERSNGLIRILDFNSDQVKTLYSYTSNALSQQQGQEQGQTMEQQQEGQGQDQEMGLLQFEHSVQSGGDFPGLDLQSSSYTTNGNINAMRLFVVDTVNLYQIASVVTIDGKEVATTVASYSGLSDYLNHFGYPIDANLRSCIYSVAPDERRGVLYVSVSYAKNVILQVSLSPRCLSVCLCLSVSLSVSLSVCLSVFLSLSFSLFLSLSVSVSVSLSVSVSVSRLFPLDVPHIFLLV